MKFNYVFKSALGALLLTSVSSPLAYSDGHLNEGAFWVGDTKLNYSVYNPETNPEIKSILEQCMIDQVKEVQMAFSSRPDLAFEFAAAQNRKDKFIPQNAGSITFELEQTTGAGDKFDLDIAAEKTFGKKFEELNESQRSVVSETLKKKNLSSPLSGAKLLTPWLRNPGTSGKAQREDYIRGINCSSEISECNERELEVWPVFYTNYKTCRVIPANTIVEQFDKNFPSSLVKEKGVKAKKEKHDRIDALLKQFERQTQNGEEEKAFAEAELIHQKSVIDSKLKEVNATKETQKAEAKTAQPATKVQ